MTRKELLQIPGLGALMETLDGLPTPASALEPPAKCPPHLASPGEVWRVKEPDASTQQPDYSLTNPHCSTVLILKREEELGGNLPKDLAVFRVAPVLPDIRYCGVEDAVFPREVFGYEAAVACGCEFTLTSKELIRCEGVLPDEWFDQLADFAAWMEAEDGEKKPPFPLLLKTGRPFTHTDDPGYIFHANLAANLQPLMASVLEELVPAEVSEPRELEFADALAQAGAFLRQMLSLATASASSSQHRTSEDGTLDVEVSADEAGRLWVHISSTRPEFSGGRFRIEAEPAHPVLVFRESAPGVFEASARITTEMADAIAKGAALKLTPFPREP